MNLSIGKISLRTRLYLLTGIVLIAFLIAIISAVRTARTSDIFAQRQAAIDVNWAAREIAQEAKDYESDRSDFERNRKLLPHLREINNRYPDVFSRTTAAALHRFENISGGFCTTDGNLKGEIINQSLSVNEISQIKNFCREMPENNSSEKNKIELGENSLFIVVTPFSGGKKEFNDSSINGVFAVRQVSQSNIFTDRFNLLTQLFLLMSIIVSVLFAFLTLRDWRKGMFKIETGLNAIGGNLTERIDAPKIAELNHISKEINRLAENLEANILRQKQLESDLTRNEKLAALGRVASGVAHEVRNPLASMKLKIQLAERQKTGEAKIEKTFAVLLEEIERLDGIVKKLLDVSRPAKLNFAEINVKNIIERRISLLKEKAENENIEVKLSAEKNLQAKADGEKLAQVFDNLLLNAIEAMPGGGVLRISTAKKDTQIMIEIADEGAGISENVKARLFEPFFTTKDKGTGLGLAISREIIEAHGGRLYAAESAKGAKFVIELPAEDYER